MPTKRTYVCVDCGAKLELPKGVYLLRQYRTYCIDCCSTFFKPVSRMAKRDVLMVGADRVRVAGAGS